jgi:hypothetical protein
MRGSWRDDEMADTKCSESRQDMDMTRAREEAMCGARGDRFGVTDTPLREGLPRATARPTLHGIDDGPVEAADETVVNSCGESLPTVCAPSTSSAILSYNGNGFLQYGFASGCFCNR